MNPGFRPVLGPYNVYHFTGPKPVEVVTLPFAEVVGAQVLINIQDNLAGGNGADPSSKVTSENLLACAIVEVSIVGEAYGIATVLKVIEMRMVTGPARYIFAENEGFQNVSFRARMLRGGLPNMDPGPIAYTPETEFSALAGYNALLTLSVQPRMLFPKPDRNPCR